jgi:hypothetical protein
MEFRLFKQSSPSFFIIIGLIGLFGALTGFMSTFFIPLSKGSFQAPFVIYLHGFFAFSWVILFVAQATLIRYRKYQTHIFLGLLGVAIALGAAITMIPAGIFATGKELAGGAGDIAYASTVGSLSSAILFLSLVSLAVFYRKRPDYHKRFMLLATILVLWPAWFRFRHYFPNVPRPDIWFGLVLSDSLIILAWIFDRRLNGRIHPVLLFGGIAIIAENIAEIILFDKPIWQSMGKLIYHA